MKNKIARLVSMLGALLLASCTYNVRGTPTYEDSGVKRLYTLPNGNYKNLGLHSWGFYRPSFSEPTIADVWDALSENVIALDGNACIVRYERVGWLTARTLEVTCEVLKLGAADQ
jgi:hypothetical protein